MRRKHWPRHGGLGLGLGPGGYPGALYSGNNWTYNSTTGLWSANPALGLEELLNGDFSAWTADNPDNWSVPAEDANNYVTENPAGKCQLVWNNVIYIGQSTLVTGKWYRATIDIDTVTSGFGRITANNSWGLYSTTGAKICTGLALGATIYFYRASASGNITIDNFSVKQLTSSDLFCLRNFGKQVALKSPLTIPVNMIGGVVSRYSDANNFVLAYHDGTNAILYKCIAGTYTNLISSAAAYADGRYIEIRWAGADTIQLYYNNAQIGANQDVSTVPAGNWGGMFMTGTAADGCYIGTPVIS